MTKWIEKKDLTYWLIIVILISLLSSNFGKNDEALLNNWNFAATIVSIILAVLAIVYTYAQSSTTVHSTNKLEESAKKIEEVSSALNKISLDDLFKNLENKILGLEKNVDEKMKIHLESYSEKIFGLFGNDISDSPIKEEDLLSADQWDDYIKQYIEKPSLVGIVLVHLHFKKKYNLSYGFGEVARWWIDRTKNQNLSKDALVGHFNGIIGMLMSLNIVDLEAETSGSGIKKTTVNHIATNLEKAIENYVESNPDKILIKSTREFVDKL
ncbi:hypothetical protein [Planomicrobium sp. CPCC 101079]|uniref:hypothetical protein n=1 Tax=Planomicrobium sp. CPCC 101079 TaxID=2599618 RepID=UPI0011B6750A|nr:hypothetical protein [Planomicrobium sp. CPCC 101079]TWT13275.1 hypothetical protein FQV28_02240 [Planomicrobium sp. CPCC 101079]